MANATLIGIDLGKHCFFLHAQELVDASCGAGRHRAASCTPRLSIAPPARLPCVAGGVKPLKDGVAKLSKALNNKGAVWPPRGCWDVQRVRQNGGSSRTWVSQ
ncbi:hypothetical protein R69658_08097 [Paraburkholderia aspalathi]|uniref:Transposase n=1 Tax=Paraburkholderia aspalathi TaxID=1324617 RepID=A0ABM8T900_9BURK|nr:hypothetical protein R69658_08097 [Paraburkholderia aspalathi]